MTLQYGIIIPEPLYTALRVHLLQGEREEVALLFAHQVITPEATRLVVRRWEPVPNEALQIHEEEQFALDSAFLVRHAKQARLNEESMVLAHSHPGDPSTPRFSRADTVGEKDLYDFLRVRLPGRPHGAIVISPGGIAGRLNYDSRHTYPAEVRVVGRRVVAHAGQHHHRASENDPLRARQELLWGSRGQSRLRQARVAVIGAGGTGSVTAQQLIHLGVGTLITVDEQVAAASNIARIVGMHLDDIDHTAKVDIVARVAKSLDPTIQVHPVHASVCSAEVLRGLRDVDLVFLCTDGHWSRAAVNALAVQYSIPLIDMAFAITLNEAATRVASAVGEIRIVTPGGYCLSCIGALDADRIRAEKANPAERAAFPQYFVNLEIDDPSVITVNSTLASLAVSLGVDMLIPTMSPVGPYDSYQYNALKGLVRHQIKPGIPSCSICGADGIAGLADDHPLPCR